MWTAEIIDTGRTGETGFVRVELSQGAETITKQYTLTFARDLEWLKRQVSAEVEKLEAIDQLLTVLPLGPFDYTVTEPDASDREVFGQDYKNYQRVKRAIDDGLLDAREPKVVTMEAEVKQAFRPEYIGLPAD